MIDIAKGLPRHRTDWSLAVGDVDEQNGEPVARQGLGKTLEPAIDVADMAQKADDVLTVDDPGEILAPAAFELGKQVARPVSSYPEGLSRRNLSRRDRPDLHRNVADEIWGDCGYLTPPAEPSPSVDPATSSPKQ